MFRNIVGLPLGVAIAVTALFDAPPATAASALETELRESAQNLPQMNLKVIGLHSAASEWAFLEKPFWTKVAPDLSGGRITAHINSQAELNLKGPDVYRLVKLGVVEIAEIVANYGAGDVPELDGLDLAGVAQSFDEEKKVVDTYMPVIKERLEKQFGLVTLGGGPSTAQVFWCRAKVASMDDIKGKKVRLTSATLADLVAGLGGTPVNLSFGEAVPAMQQGVIDCIITGTASGNTAKLFEIGNYLFPLVAGWAPRIRIVNKQWWNGLDPKVRTWFQKASDYYFREMSDPIEDRNNSQGLLCSTGDNRCTLAGPGGFMTKAQMQLGAVTAAEERRLKGIVEASVLPSFAKACGPECTKTWNATIGKLVGLTARAQ